MRLRTKSAGTIEQKGVAQLLQIEKVRLKSSRRCGFSQSPHAQEETNFGGHGPSGFGDLVPFCLPS